MTDSKLEARYLWIRETVDMEIKKGFESHIKGWSMKNVLKKFDDVMDRMYARKYIVKDLCGINES